jgi:hypothetical protein
MRFLFLILLLLIGPSRGRAEDLVTLDGTVFNNITVLSYQAEGLVLKHDGGTNRVAWKELSAANRQRYQAEARRQKEQEIQKLKQDLARAEAEAARLNQADGRAPEAKHTPAADRAGRSDARRSAEPVVAPAGRSVADLPPLNPDEILDATDLVEQFKSDPAGAERRYRKKKLRVRGVIERFEPVLFVRKYDVLLESPDRFIRVVASFDYPNDCRAVYATHRGQTLIGKPAENKEVTLMQAGQAIVLQGTCKGVHDAGIVFTGCAVAGGDR